MHLQSDLDMVMQSIRQGSLFLYLYMLHEPISCSNPFVLWNRIVVQSLSIPLSLLQLILLCTDWVQCFHIECSSPHQKHWWVTCWFGYILPSLFPWTTLNQIGYVFVQPVEWHWHHPRMPCFLRLLVHMPGHPLLPHLLSCSIICWVVVWLTHLPVSLLT